jgi:hypothetical protein
VNKVAFSLLDFLSDTSLRCASEQKAQNAFCVISSGALSLLVNLMHIKAKVQQCISNAVFL